MANEINILEICRSDDVDGAKEYIRITRDVDHTVNDKEGKKLTGAWLAAYLGARKVLTFLVRQGANLDFKVDNYVVRDLGRINREVLLGLIEGGMRPNASEIQLLFWSDFQNEIPRDGLVAALDAIIIEHPDLLLQEENQQIQIIGESDAVGQLFPELSASVSMLSSMRHEEAKALRQQLGNTMVTLCTGFLNIMRQATKLVSDDLDNFDKVIVKNFQSYRKNRSWLAEATRRSRNKIASLWSKRLDLYEDDDDFCTIIDLAIARYPIKERISGLPDVGISVRSNGVDFEIEARDLLEEAGFEVAHIGTTGDQGADLIAKKFGLSYAIQCKNHSVPVGNASVQQALSAKTYYQCDYAVVCAPNGFTKSAKSLGSSAGVILIPPSLLHDLVVKIKRTSPVRVAEIRAHSRTRRVPNVRFLPLDKLRALVD